MKNKKNYLYTFFDNSFSMLEKLDQSIMNLYEMEYKRLSNNLYNHDTIKPSKIFKSRYNKWLLERNNIVNELENIIKKIEEEIKYLL